MLTNALTDPVAGLNQLIRQGNIDFPASAVTMIDSLAEAGDTAGADAVIMQTLSGSIGGLATAAAGAPGAALTQLGNQMTALGTVIGNDLLPLLDAIAKYMGPVIQAIETWTAAHPKLTDAIVIGTLALTALLLIVGLIGVAIITITPVVALLTTVFGALSVAAALPLLPFILLGAAIVLLATLIIVNWTNLKDDMEAIGQAISADWDASWNSIYSFGQNIIGQIKNFIHTEMTDVANDWNAIWTGIANFFSNIWSTIVNGLKSDINNVISLINGLISAIDALHISIPAITIPGTKIGTPAVNIGFDIPQIPALASGGIVSVPTVALIGEGGPEAVVPLSSSSFGGVGGGGAPTQIVINIQGGNYLDQNGATMIGNALAKQIIQQIRVKNYAL
jgi:phage-related protein